MKSNKINVYNALYILICFTTLFDRKLKPLTPNAYKYNILFKKYDEN